MSYSPPNTIPGITVLSFDADAEQSFTDVGQATPKTFAEWKFSGFPSDADELFKALNYLYAIFHHMTNHNKATGTTTIQMHSTRDGFVTFAAGSPSGTVSGSVFTGRLDSTTNFPFPSGTPRTDIRLRIVGFRSEVGTSLIKHFIARIYLFLPIGVTVKRIT